MYTRPGSTLCLITLDLQRDGCRNVHHPETTHVDTEFAPSTDRLFAAADALLKAFESPAGANETVPMTLDRPTIKSLSGVRAFTPNELVCAMEMLMRMGFAVPKARP